MKSFSSRLIPVAVASILCGVALAGGGKDDHMKMMDQNGDGKVTAAEHDAAVKDMFSKMDTDKDGFVTAQEMDAMHASMMQDKGHATARTESGPTEEKMADKKAYDPSGTGKSMPKMMSSEQKIAKMDTNNDGKLSAAEYSAGAKQMFGKMDKDGDGSLTAQEVRDGQRSMMASDE
jgi:Ca2+-binding EF-hand superfamily protein